jgi:hypothetical protein
MREAISCLVCALAGGIFIQAPSSTAHVTAPSVTPDTIIERFLATGTDVPLTSYRAFRTLEASSRGGKMHGRLTAQTSIDPSLGFQYSIVEESGSGLIRGRVLRAALETERSMHQAGELGKGALSQANYQFTTIGPADEGLIWVGMRPKRRDTLLIEGRMMLTEDTGDLVRVEGLLVKRPSVWTRRVEVAREYARIGGVRVPVSMQSNARVLIAGASTFSMTYEYEWINGQPVAMPERQIPAGRRE